MRIELVHVQSPTMKNLLATLLLIWTTMLVAQPVPPTQHTFGPGSNDYPHAGYDSTFYGSDINDMYWIFEPAAPTPADSAGVIFLWHGTTKATVIDSMDVVDMHIGLIRHLVRKGFTIVYPMYQYGSQEIVGGQSGQRDTCAEIVKKAMFELETGAHVRPKRYPSGAYMVGTCGHSRGGNLSATLMANFNTLGIPQFRAVVAIVGFDPFTPEADLNLVPAETKWLSIIADNDTNLANLITEPVLIDRYCMLTSIPPSNKKLLRVNSDSLDPSDPVTADHHFYEAEPGSGNIDVLDFRGGWKLTEALMNCAFFNTDCEYCLTNPDSITYMGQWDNGVDFQPIWIVDSCFAGSVGEVADPQIELHPNPVQDQLTVQIPGPYNGSMQIVDIAGKVVFTQDHFTTGSIDISAIRPGYYFVVFENEKGAISAPLIVN